jgi:hypothetical protein
VCAYIFTLVCATSLAYLYPSWIRYHNIWRRTHFMMLLFIFCHLLPFVRAEYSSKLDCNTNLVNSK